MDTASPNQPADFQGLRVDLLRQAVDTFLRVAYAGAALPASVKRRIEWPSDLEACELLNLPQFERPGRTREVPVTIRALRLGNAAYPHMKLQIQPWPNAAGFLLSVNTHDQVQLIDPDSPEADRFRALQSENQRYKEAIESAWDAEGLPIFLRYLRDYITSNLPATPPQAEST
ncbi:hypothetical protein EP7_003973 [Isosphaeraceae bacterium EP7]